MHDDYGYIEEGKLGKPYNVKLLRRLATYALPQKKVIIFALFLTILFTLFELALPYFSKIAIDRYILSSWYRVDRTGHQGTGDGNLIDGYRHLLVEDRAGTSFYISHLDMKIIDPTILYRLKDRQIISPERFYRTEPDVQLKKIMENGEEAVHIMADGSLMIPFDLLNSLEKEEILKVRARDVKGVGLMALFLLILIGISFWSSYGQYYLLEFTGQHIMQDIRLRLFNRMQSQAISFFERHPVGLLVTRVTNDVENLNEMFKSVIVTVFKDVFLLTGILIILLSINWRLALVCFALIPFIFGVTFMFSTMAREAFRQLRTTVAKINSFLQERITGMRVIQLFAIEEFQKNAFARTAHEGYLAGMKQIRVFAMFMPVMELFSAFAVALIIWHGGGKVISEHLSLGSLVAFISYIQMFFRPIRDISEKYNIMQSAMASTERIFEFMDHKEEIPDPQAPVTPSEVRGKITFRNVSFSYEKDHPVLQDISFEVNPGEMVAVVGPTGAGKTTLMNLVERFYDPDEGAILLDGIDLRKWPKSEIRTNVRPCMQDIFIFSGTIKENISMGSKDLDDRDIESAAGTANALQFITRLKSGFSQEIGEGGGAISAGERQLVSFARALVTNPRVLILDEATSSIDPETERLIQDAVLQIAAKRTTLVVAHRLSTIMNADRILVMNHGRIVEQGTHEELISLDGIYNNLLKVREN